MASVERTGKRRKGRKKLPIVINLQHCGYPLVLKCAKEMGWRVAEKGESWDVGWSDNNQLLRQMGAMFEHPRTLNPVQRVNHMPNNKQLYRKDLLATNLNALRARLPNDFAFVPRSWRMPQDRDAMVRELAAIQRARQQPPAPATADEAGPPPPAVDGGRREGEEAAEAPGPAAPPPDTYIIKPALGLQGHGIELSTAPEESRMVVEGQKGVVQLYIPRPLLLEGFKFDLRLYGGLASPALLRALPNAPLAWASSPRARPRAPQVRAGAVGAAAQALPIHGGAGPAVHHAVSAAERQEHEEVQDAPDQLLAQQEVEELRRRLVGAQAHGQRRHGVARHDARGHAGARRGHRYHCHRVGSHPTAGHTHRAGCAAAAGGCHAALR
jgi:hypothetical protein